MEDEEGAPAPAADSGVPPAPAPSDAEPPVLSEAALPVSPEPAGVAELSPATTTTVELTDERGDRGFDRLDLGDAEGPSHAARFGAMAGGVLHNGTSDECPEERHSGAWPAE